MTKNIYDKRGVLHYNVHFKNGCLANRVTDRTICGLRPVDIAWVWNVSERRRVAPDEIRILCKVAEAVRTDISHREIVMMSGCLKGMGYEAECTVSAVKVSLPQLDVWEYVNCDIHLAPEDLPDGVYQLTFEGGTMNVKKLDGDWLD